MCSGIISWNVFFTKPNLKIQIIFKRLTSAGEKNGRYFVSILNPSSLYFDGLIHLGRNDGYKSVFSNKPGSIFNGIIFPNPRQTSVAV